ncbi:MAG: cytochrome c biogenesis protein CcsA [Planctomycetes bacterium]|nr:cytochrome c biogenesis protein CcsA [Planctomycetota bacterium]
MSRNARAEGREGGRAGGWRAILLVLALAAPAFAEESRPAESHARWNRETVDLFARLPVQEGGRVKPLSTFASFTLLALNGRRGCTTPEGVRLEPTEWLMDCLFWPEHASLYSCFLVQDTQALDDLGLAHEGKSRRDRYSYTDLLPARGKLFELASQYDRIEAKLRNSVQGQVVNLAHNVMQFESITSSFYVLRSTPAGADCAAIARVFGKDARPSFSGILARAAELRPYLGMADDPHGSGASGDPVLRGWAEEVAGSPGGLALFPPPPGAAADAEWLTPGGVAAEALFGGADMKQPVETLAEFELLFRLRGDATAFGARAESFRDRVVAAARARGEYDKIPLEVAFYRGQFFYYAQVVFVFAFLIAAFGWIKPTKLVPRLTTGTVALGTLLLVAGITMRCIIRGRPPVSTLYESILFITAVSVIASMVAEWINRQGIALTLSTILGAGGMFLANRYEMQEAVDTMPSLVAVLDTNFWLASHVTTVTIGYGAGLLAGAIGHVTILGRIFGLKRNEPSFYRTLASMTYGMLCFGLLFSVVGTVLGGIWANDSWGRFWGWDPKENGALAIVLWELIVLHARKGGYIRDHGIAMCSVFGAAVVASSWWGVNLLGVGLHSYGFTSGILLTLIGYYVFEALVLVAGGVAWYLKRGAGDSAVAARMLPGPEKVG